mmetsp:Transcript_12096/g.56129  ORF Transcript_12096/g.56129 Transcript_12096/m.56129 type:complete len:215 (+) Transcript_12096:1321-1965(+)
MKRAVHSAQHAARGWVLLVRDDGARGCPAEVHRGRRLDHEPARERTFTAAGVVPRLRRAGHAEPLHGLRHASHRCFERGEYVGWEGLRAARLVRGARRSLGGPSPGEVIDHGEVPSGAGGSRVGLQPRHHRRLELAFKGKVEDGFERAARRGVGREPRHELIRDAAPGIVRRGSHRVPGAYESFGGESALEPNRHAELRLHSRVRLEPRTGATH